MIKMDNQEDDDNNNRAFYDATASPLPMETRRCSQRPKGILSASGSIGKMQSRLYYAIARAGDIG